MKRSRRLFKSWLLLAKYEKKPQFYILFQCTQPWINTTVLWEFMLCILVDMRWHFRENCCLFHQGTLFHMPWWWRLQFPQVTWCHVLQNSHGNLKPCNCRCSLKAYSHIECRNHAVPLQCRAAKGLECVLPTWFTQYGRVWFTLAMPCSDRAVLLKAIAQHGRRETAVLCCGLEKKAWSEHGMASVNQTRPYCVNRMGKTHSKPLAAQHGRGTAWARHGMCESAFTVAGTSV